MGRCGRHDMRQRTKQRENGTAKTRNKRQLALERDGTIGFYNSIAKPALTIEVDLEWRVT
jgi:hypothetical protein